MMQRRSGRDFIHSSQKLTILPQGESAHQHGSICNFFVCRFSFELGEEVHGTESS